MVVNVVLLRNLKIELNVVVSQCAACYRVVAIKFYVIIFTFYLGRGCSNTQNTPLVTALVTVLLLTAISMQLFIFSSFVWCLVLVLISLTSRRTTFTQ